MNVSRLENQEKLFKKECDFLLDATAKSIPAYLLSFMIKSRQVISSVPAVSTVIVDIGELDLNAYLS